MNLISIFVTIYYLVNVYVENTDASCAPLARNRNLPKKLYSEVSNGKANIS